MLQRDHRAAAVALLPYAILAFVLVGCGSANTASPPSKRPSDNTPTVTTIIPPVNDLAPINHTPSFAPDYNHLTAQPWVEPVTTTEQDGVDVYPDRLVFPDTMTEVGTWQPGRLVVSGPGQGAGKNAFGFARRVVKVEHVGSTYVVTTTVAAIEDILQGDFQMQLKPSAMTAMDLSKADLQWVADNLYFQSPDANLMIGEPLVDDWPEGQEYSMSFWKKLKHKAGSALKSAAKAVAKGAVETYKKITPATVSGSVKLSKNISFNDAQKLFDMSYSESFNTEKGLPFTVAISGSGDYNVDLSLNPGVQVGAKIALPGHHARSVYWLNVDSSMALKLAMDLDFSASITSGGGESGSALQQSLDEGGALAQDLLSSERKRLFGDPAMDEGDVWKKTLWISRPATQTFFAGPIPVVLTETLQVDLECGFEAKGTLKTHMEFDDNAALAFSASTRKKTDAPVFSNKKKVDLQVTGGGSASVNCGLIPRVNVFFYDSVGVFAGVRGSLVAKGDYESKCKDDPNDYRPDGELTLGLYGNIGIRTGVRAQVPGSSYAGAGGTDLGVEADAEPWNTQFPLVEKKWTFPNGFGYCLPRCKNLAKDGDETDIDCGGSCGGCPLGSACQFNSDCTNAVCNHGICADDPCGDGVEDSDETDIDCGGQHCAPCASGKECDSASDCQSTFCALSADPQVCSTDHCSDGVTDADEGGVDCGGQTCPKCATGALASSGLDCASGFSNGTICVESACFDMARSGDETDVDCGGSTCAQRCGFEQACNQSSDCHSGLSCSQSQRVCLRTNGAACSADSNCASGQCQGNVCVPDTAGCGDGVLDGAETDVDCGGPTCNKCSVYEHCMADSDCQLGICTPFAGSGIAHCTLPTNVVADWPFDGNGLDASGNGHDMVFAGGAVGYTNQAHSGTEAISFDGNYWGTVPALDVGDKFTIAGWVYVPSASTSTPVPETLISSGPSTGFPNGINFYVHSPDTTNFALGFGTGDGTNACYWESAANVTQADTWQHVAVTVDRTTGTAILYVNGVAVAGSGCVLQTFATNADLTIGAMPGGIAPAMENLDDLRIYNTILTPAEIATLAQ